VPSRTPSFGSSSVWEYASIVPGTTGFCNGFARLTTPLASSQETYEASGKRFRTRATCSSSPPANTSGTSRVEA
jgi:hypothetical protein